MKLKDCSSWAGKQETSSLFKNLQPPFCNSFLTRIFSYHTAQVCAEYIEEDTTKFTSQEQSRKEKRNQTNKAKPPPRKEPKDFWFFVTLED